MISISRQHRSKFVVFAFAATGMLALSAADKPPDDPVIEAARKAATAYEQSLPDYIVRRETTRYRGGRATLTDPPEAVQIWHKVDTVSAQVASEHGKETYSEITRDGKPGASLPNGGAWSGGEFTSELQTILAPERSASFTHKRSEKIGNRNVFRYDYAVDATHSVWHMAADRLPGQPGPQTLSPGYGGEIWIDSETGQVLRVQLFARGLPEWFVLSAVHTDTEYSFVHIGEADYVLPTRSVSATCERDGRVCLKNETVFRDYDKFTANANITFDGGGK
jgi:hypothetical protein